MELAARIGQALVQRNEMLEADLSAAVDLRQRHEHQVWDNVYCGGHFEGALIGGNFHLNADSTA